MSVYVDGVEISLPASFDFVQGEDLDIDFEFQHVSDDTNPDLTGATLEVSFAKEYGQSVLGSFTEVSSDPANATWVMRLPGSVSELLTPRANSRITSYVMDVKLTFSGGVVHYPVYGYLKMQRRVTA